MVFDVHNEAELYKALEQASWGDTVKLHKASQPYNLRLDPHNYQADGVTFESADLGNPAEITSVQLYSSRGVTFDGLRFVESSNSSFPDAVFLLRDVENIKVQNSSLEGSATQTLTYKGNERAAIDVANVKYASGLTFENNEFSHFNLGLTLLESQNVRIVGNEFHSMQGDPIQLGGVQNVFVENNFIHDLLGSDANINHLDMIQLWSTGAESNSQDIYIRDNILDSGDGMASQSIFLHNETFKSTGQQYQNIQVTGNVIYNSHTHGISVSHAENVKVLNNTLILNRDAYVLEAGGQTQTVPSIWIWGTSKGVEIRNNFASDIVVPSGSVQTNNHIANYDDPLSPVHISNVFTDPYADDLDVMIDLQVLPGSLVQQRGAGSDLLDFDYSPDNPYGLFQSEPGKQLLLNNHSFDVSRVFDESGAMDTSDAKVTWNFGDGNITSSGTKTDHFYRNPGEYDVTATIELANGQTIIADKKVSVQTAVALANDFHNRAADSSPYGVDGTTHGAVKFVNDQGSKVVKLDGGHIAYPWESNYVNNSGFSVVVDFRKDDPGDTGAIFWFGRSFTLAASLNNGLQASFDDGSGAKWINEQYLDIGDEDWHRAVITFDGERGEGAMYVDGVLIQTISGLGSLQSGTLDDLYIGSPYSRSFNGLIDNFSFLRGAMSPEQVSALGAAGSGVDAMTRSFLNGSAPDLLGLSATNGEVIAEVEEVVQEESGPTPFEADIVEEVAPIVLPEEPEQEPEPEPEAPTVPTSELDEFVLNQGATIRLDGYLDKSEFFLDQSRDEITVDVDGDGAVDARIELRGDFSGGHFLAVYAGDQTIVEFAPFIEELVESRALKDWQINGLNNEKYFYGSDAIDAFAVTLISSNETAIFSNSIGVYEYDSAGRIYDPRIIVENAKTNPGTVVIEDLDNGKMLGFFLVQDGYNRLDQTALRSDDLSLSFGSNGIVLKDGDITLSDATVFLSHDGSLNPDGKEHVVSGHSRDTDGLQIGFEDMLRNSGADNDFQDVVMLVQAIDTVA